MSVPVLDDRVDDCVSFGGCIEVFMRRFVVMCWYTEVSYVEIVGEQNRTFSSVFTTLNLVKRLQISAISTCSHSLFSEFHSMRIRKTQFVFTLLRTQNVCGWSISRSKRPVITKTRCFLREMSPLRCLRSITARSILICWVLQIDDFDVIHSGRVQTLNRQEKTQNTHTIWINQCSPTSNSSCLPVHHC